MIACRTSPTNPQLGFQRLDAHQDLVKRKKKNHAVHPLVLRICVALHNNLSEREKLELKSIVAKPVHLAVKESSRRENYCKRAILNIYKPFLHHLFSCGSHRSISRDALRDVFHELCTAAGLTSVVEPTNCLTVRDAASERRVAQALHHNTSVMEPTNCLTVPAQHLHALKQHKIQSSSLHYNIKGPLHK